MVSAIYRAGEVQAGGCQGSAATASGGGGAALSGSRQAAPQAQVGSWHSALAEVILRCAQARHRSAVGKVPRLPVTGKRHRKHRYGCLYLRQPRQCCRQAPVKKFASKAPAPLGRGQRYLKHGWDQSNSCEQVGMLRCISLGRCTTCSHHHHPTPNRLPAMVCRETAVDDWEAEMDQRWAKRSSFGGSAFSMADAGAASLEPALLVESAVPSGVCWSLIAAVGMFAFSTPHVGGLLAVMTQSDRRRQNLARSSG